jgi:hypothetical protein
VEIIWSSRVWLGKRLCDAFGVSFVSSREGRGLKRIKTKKGLSIEKAPFLLFYFLVLDELKHTIVFVANHADEVNTVSVFT